jgi:hypothetical protein
MDVFELLEQAHHREVEEYDVPCPRHHELKAHHGHTAKDGGYPQPQ